MRCGLWYSMTYNHSFNLRVVHNLLPKTFKLLVCKLQIFGKCTPGGSREIQIFKHVCKNRNVSPWIQEKWIKTKDIGITEHLIYYGVHFNSLIQTRILSKIGREEMPAFGQKREDSKTNVRKLLKGMKGIWKQEERVNLRGP